MAKITIYNQAGQEAGDFELPKNIFEVKVNHDVLHQVLLAQRANARHSIAHTKGRGEVRGGGKKPWKQKGTGRSRHGSIRSPIWKGGGVAFGPTKERNFAQKINKKMKRQALYMALSSKLQDHQLLMLEGISFSVPKTKEAFTMVKNLSTKLVGYKTGRTKSDSILLVVPHEDKMVMKSARNLPFVEVMSAKSLNVEDILKNKYMIVVKDAVPVIQTTFTL